VPYWGPGYFDMAGMDRMIRAQKLVGALSGDVDWSKIVDISFLSDDLKTKNKRSPRPDRQIFSSRLAFS